MLQHPLPVKISAHYGALSAWRKARGMQPHSGTDYVAKRGTPFRAVGDGTVSLVQFSKVLGWVTVHTVTVNGETWHVGYCHQDQKPALEVGDKIKRGQVIGKVGVSGQVSGAHLHMTFGKSAKAVFGVTKIKSDGYKIIEANKAKPKPPAKSKATAPDLSITCPKCGTEYHAQPQDH